MISGFARIVEERIHKAQKKLNYLIMKLNTLRCTAIEFEEPQKYSDKLIDKLESSVSNHKKKI